MRLCGIYSIECNHRPHNDCEPICSLNENKSIGRNCRRRADCIAAFCGFDSITNITISAMKPYLFDSTFLMPFSRIF